MAALTSARRLAANAAPRPEDRAHATAQLVADAFDIIQRETVFAHSYVDAKVMAEALLRIGTYVAERGLRGEGPYQAARDLLLREPPRTGGQPLHRAGETAVDAAVRICAGLTGGILPIQGPPGAGKTYTGAQMICELVRRGRACRHYGEQSQGHPQSDR
jgi:hypothetical protein